MEREGVKHAKSTYVVQAKHKSKQNVKSTKIHIKTNCEWAEHKTRENVYIS